MATPPSPLRSTFFLLWIVVLAVQPALAQSGQSSLPAGRSAGPSVGRVAQVWLPAPEDASLKALADSLCLGWNAPNHPGGVIGVMVGQEVRLLQAYGLASLEYLVPNQTETIFNTGSVSKQFTAMGIVRLEEAGKLSVDDDIRTYIPELPDLGHTITIRHLMHHTSGLRSLHAMLEMAGWRGDDSRTNEDLYRFMARQQDLNFVPGDEYLYCNTGYMYMARIVEEVTGEAFPAWMRAHVFEPLGLDHTYVEDQYNRVVPQNATSYYGNAESGFDRAVEYWGYVGSGNMHSTVRDLLHWLSQFYAPAPGWEASFERLQTLDPFNDGTPNGYAFGVNVGTYRGRERVGHGGSIGGFRAQVAVFPEEELALAVLTNFNAGNPGGKVNALADHLLEVPGGPAMTENRGTSDQTEEAESLDLSRTALQAYEGYFWNAADKQIRRIYLRADTLRYARNGQGESPLLPVAEGSFRMLGVGSDPILVRFDGAGGDRRMVLTRQGAPLAELVAYAPGPGSAEELGTYAGQYYSPELETTYTLRRDDQKLIGYHPRHGEIPVRRIKEDVLEAEWPLGILEIERGPDGQVTGLYATNGRVRNLWMKRLAE